MEFEDKFREIIDLADLFGTTGKCAFGRTAILKQEIDLPQDY